LVIYNGTELKIARLFDNVSASGDLLPEVRSWTPLGYFSLTSQGYFRPQTPSCVQYNFFELF